ncbi:MAG: ribosome-associated translation inhibitor RaiA [Candidatus Magnetomorum sp.]|nr:ribosome-associated translation inhibitor RaiA [Candidatus Magnetomorum sp.]
MQTSVTFKNLKPSDDLKNYIGSKLDRFDRYLDNPAESNVVFSIEKFRHIVEVTIIGDRLNINGREEQEDMYSAIDIVLDKLEKQIKKSKGKQKNRRAQNRGKMDMSVLESEIPDFDNEPQVEIMNIEYKPMSEEEAIEQMSIIDNAFLVFTNAKSNRVNVLYRKNDGNYGLIQPVIN